MKRIGLFTLLLGACGDSGVTLSNAVTANVPASTYANNASTWWGYNMQKVVRDGERVYFLVVEDDESLQPTTSPKTNASLNLYLSVADATPMKVFSAPASKPGNVLVDSHGGVHVFAFEATDPNVSDSSGRLVHYAIGGARTGDFANVVTRIVVDHHAGEGDLVNIRTGAAIGVDDSMAVAYGLTYYGDGDKAFVINAFNPTSGQWQMHVEHPVEHDFYYPLVTIDSNGTIYAMPVQDDQIEYNGGTSNTYYRIDLFKLSGNTFDERTLIDLNDHPYARNYERRALLEQSDLMVDSNNEIHLIYKEKLLPDTDIAFGPHVYCHGAFDSLQCTEMPSWTEYSVNWARFFEIDGELYAWLSTWDRHFIAKLSTREEVELRVDAPEGCYPYVSGSPGGTNRDESKIDVYLITGSNAEYPGAHGVLLTMDKSEIADLF